MGDAVLNETAPAIGEALAIALNTLGECHVPMKVPFSFKGCSYPYASLRVPTGRDFRDWNALPERARTAHAWLKLVLAAPVEILDEMHAADYVECLNALKNHAHQPNVDL
ncbi:MAG: hypothetical protein ACR652_22440 [Methylocystis sp.]|uniref:hypothetical protein n=1 Tax=Methylocystis sp. TaxID=1911079 RepID=UPI003DA40C32